MSKSEREKMRKNELNKVYNQMEKNIFKLQPEGNLSRLGKVFQTKNKKYYYDMGTGKVFEVSSNVYMVLKNIFNTNNLESVFNLGLSTADLSTALEEINNSIEKENILSAPLMTKMVGEGVDCLEQKLKKEIISVTLEITERCNLRCKYCIYNEDDKSHREFGENEMSFETAKKAIDFANLHSGNKINIGFYGGEPLLRYKFIQRCIEYTKQNVKKEELRMSMTTNGTLMTKERSDYFAGIDKFRVTFSVDGPKKVHDENRVFIDGTGTHKLTMQGLKNMIDSCIEKGKNPAERISINTVTSGPNYKEKFDLIQDFYDGLEWLPKDIDITFSYVSHDTKRSPYIKPNSREEEEFIDNILSGGNSPILEWTVDKVAMKTQNELKDSSLFSKDMFDKDLLTIHKRLMSQNPADKYLMNACCVPGSRKLLVKTNGDFSACEMIGDSPSLGNVDIGFNIDKIRKYYIEDFCYKSLEACNNCWASHLCTLCYVKCYDKNGFQIEKRYTQCMSERYRLTMLLIQYYDIIEKSFESLEYLSDIKLV